MIKDLRLQSGLSQRTFAEYFNIPVRTLQDWESEKRTPPTYVIELIKYKLEKEYLIMKDYNGMKWGQLSEDEKEMLLSEASAIDASTGCKPKLTSDCTIDLNSSYSVPGRIIVNEDYDEIVIDDEAKIYNPSL